MPTSVLGHTRIEGISVVVPPKEMCLLDEPHLYNGNTKKIERVIHSSGFYKRRVAEKNILTSDLCLQASHDLLAHTGCKKEQIDALIFISYTPDYLMPATGYILHRELGLSKNCLVMDMPQACSGYVLGLFQASMLLNSGYKNVLLLVGDTFSKFTDMFLDNTAPVFGDAGSATLLTYSPNANPFYYHIQSDGKGAASIMCENGAFRHPPTLESFYEDGSYMYKAKMHGGEVFDFTMGEVAQSIRQTLDFANIPSTVPDYYILHQANKSILQNIARQLGIEESKMPMDTLTQYGNQCGASIPGAVADALQAEVSAKKLCLLLSGFGTGLSLASAVVETDHIYCSGIQNYKETA